MIFRSHTTQRRPALVAIATTFMLVAIAAFGSARASAVSDSEELFSILLPRGEAAGEMKEFLGTPASDPVTGHFFFSDRNLARIDEFTPWGDFVKAIGWDVAPGPVNEQQEVRIRASAGQFRLSFGGATTSDLALEATAKGPQAAVAIENALDALPTIGGAAGGEVSVTASQGTPDGITPYVYVVAFKGSLAGEDADQMTIEPGGNPLPAASRPRRRRCSPGQTAARHRRGSRTAPQNRVASAAYRAPAPVSSWSPMVLRSRAAIYLCRRRSSGARACRS